MQPMKWSGKLILIIVVFSCCSVKNTSKQVPPIYSIIPHPQELVKNPNFFLLNNQTSIYSDSTLKKSTKQLIKLIKKEYDISLNHSTSIKKENCIILANSNNKKNDYYELNISEKLITINASSEVGYFYASQTIFQLLDHNNLNKSQNFKLPALKINDWSKFKHRGMLLDCCRHFFSVSTIKKYLRLMSYYKMNILHWHLTEDQGWRIAIDKYPNLITKGAYRNENNKIYGDYYSKSEMKEVVEYAKSLNINIIPEIELPGHSQAAIAAYPHLSCTGETYEVANDWGVFKEIYCAGNDSVFTFLEDVLNEVIEIFPYEYIHIGGDEAPKYRWENCKKCQKRIKQNNLKDEHELQSYFIKRISKFLKSKGKSIIGWDEILEGGLAKNAIVQSWRGTKGGIEAAKSGNKAIMSPTSHAYFDYSIKTTDLEKVYSFRPIPNELNKNERKLIIGGECNVWTEHINNEEELDSKVFPRLLAMAEVLWTNENESDFEGFKKRLQNHYPILKIKEVDYGIEVLPCKIDVERKNEKLNIKLIKGSNELELKYKWGNTTNYIKYSEDSVIENNSGELFVQTFKNGNKYGDIISQPFKFHKAVAKTTNYRNKYSPSYPANNEISLTDAKLGTLEFRDGNWQGFWDTNIDCTIDLKEITEIEKIKTRFYQYNNSWIFFPEKIKYQTSIDSLNWTKWNEISNKHSPKDRGEIIQEFLSKKSKTKTRYINIQTQRLEKVPHWHEAAGAKTWLFLDEIIVE
jgi:hexosaminidase